jgi:hypothetical protein
MDAARTVMAACWSGCARAGARVARLGSACGLALAGAALAQPAAPVLPPVALDYFGLVLSRADAAKAWPGVPFGSWRIWDSYTTWPYLEPERGHWEFAALDRMVDEAAAHHTKALLVLAHSPKWASARPTEASGYRPGFSAEPRQLDDWKTYVATVAARYKGRIEAYQIWNEPSDKIHFTGTVQQMVDLVCSAYKEIKAADPAAKVVSPGSAGGGRHIQYLEDFLARGGAKCIDVVAHHFYVPRFGPEEMVPMIRQVRAVMQRQGVAQLPLWNTETGWWIANTDGTPDHPIVAKGGWRKLDADQEAGATIQRAFLLSRAEGVERFYWYAWTNAYGWGLTDGADKPKPATRYWNKLADAIVGRRVTGCTEVAPTMRCSLVPATGPAGTVEWDTGDALVRREGPVSAPGGVGRPPFK